MRQTSLNNLQIVVNLSSGYMLQIEMMVSDPVLTMSTGPPAQDQ